MKPRVLATPLSIGLTFVVWADTFVLVHGAWQGGWAWREVAPLPEEQGHTILTSDLLGHGGDTTALTDISLEAYEAALCERLHRRPTRSS